jgi:hypothetical protein
VLSRLYPLDKEANADGRRRALPPGPAGAVTSSAPKPAGMAPLLRSLMARYAATGLPPAYIPQPSAPTGAEKENDR